MSIEKLEVFTWVLGLMATQLFQTYTIFKVSRSKNISGLTKIMWILIIFLAPILGAGIFIFQQRSSGKIRNGGFRRPFDKGRLRT